MKVNGDVELVAHGLAQAGDTLYCCVDFVQMIDDLKSSVRFILVALKPSAMACCADAQYRPDDRRQPKRRL
ncbi:MAG: hypothetical protein CM15mP120_19430 [Pseudomonadota bacterium]|nr:MAG: hypothetical protein CM15mP120_19430 [Pseudomonadota bacterium]